GLAAGLGLDPDDVSSPSFALVHEYGPVGKPPVLVHVDLFRLPVGDAAVDLGLDELGSAPLAVEWPRPPLTKRRAWHVALRIEQDGSRTIDVEPPGIRPSSP
ncbi:MAG: tRNA (adenosine(37)-N6)-threonylcarbamoyltransferase complex ATPase subunit type 1 TsaE, partial [Thermoanaerobaculia bacterium]